MIMNIVSRPEVKGLAELKKTNLVCIIYFLYWVKYKYCSFVYQQSAFHQKSARADTMNNVSRSSFIVMLGYIKICQFIYFLHWRTQKGSAPGALSPQIVKIKLNYTRSFWLRKCTTREFNGVTYRESLI